tara:strand:- start:403 stop:585 length:183 start_codon:yes stop_codon:yes gene_type:complete
MQEISLITSYQSEQVRKKHSDSSLLAKSLSLRNSSTARYKSRFRQLNKRNANKIEYPIAS